MQLGAPTARRSLNNISPIPHASTPPRPPGHHRHHQRRAAPPRHHLHLAAQLRAVRRQHPHRHALRVPLRRLPRLPLLRRGRLVRAQLLHPRPRALAHPAGAPAQRGGAGGRAGGRGGGGQGVRGVPGGGLRAAGRQQHHAGEQLRAGGQRAGAEGGVRGFGANHRWVARGGCGAQSCPSV